MTLVDEDDFEWLSSFSWCAGSRNRGTVFYAKRAILVEGIHRTISMHRQIMGLVFGDGLEVDHRNHDPLDNRRHNLRVVTPQGNKENQKARGGSSSYVGVTWDRARRKWRAQIQHAGKVINLGRYATETEAAQARNDYVRNHQTLHEVNY